MTRNLFCIKCGIEKPMHPEDLAAGFQRRRVTIKGRKPEVHEITITTFPGGEVERKPLSSLMCDGCGCVMPDNTDMIAVTMWRDSEGEPGNWEADYSL